MKSTLEKRSTSPTFNADWQRLADRIDGDLSWDALNRALYASSAAIVEVWPSAVLCPKHQRDVGIALRFCAEHRIPVTCRGAGSGVVGQSLGEGLIIDFSVHMAEIIEINNVEEWVHVQPGVIKDALDAELSAWRYFWPPDPSSSPWCTVGAMIANNSGGAKSVKYGTARDYLLELDLMDFEGQAFKLRPLKINEYGRIDFPSDASFKERSLAEHTYKLIRENRSLIKEHQPKTTRNSSGYNLFQVLPLDRPLPDEKHFDNDPAEIPTNWPLPDKDHAGAHQTGSPWILDMPRLFCGSEGTLGVLLSAKISIVKLPKAIAGASLSFASDKLMAEAVVKLLADTRPAKLELLERSFIDVAAQAEPELAEKVPDQLKTLLIVEYYGADAADAQAQTKAAIAAVCEESELAFDSHFASDPKELEDVWRIRKIASPVLSRVKGDVKPTRWVEDLAVPPWKLPEFIEGFLATMEQKGFPSALFGHAGEGNLHVNPKANVKSAGDRQKMREAAEEAFALVKSLGGVISGEHGDGIMRSPYLHEFFGPLYPLMEEVKKAWDPEWQLNPLCKVIAPDRREGRTITSDLRLGADYSRHPMPPELNRPEVLETIEKCHGCGKCRNYCPLMSVGQEEKYSARAKANLLRGVVSGKLDPEWLLDDEFKANIDLCINCSQCLTDCPTQVDIPGMAIAFREYYRSKKGGEGIVSNLYLKPDRIGKAASWMSGVTNALINNPVVRAIGEKATGLDERRKMPAFKPEKGLKEKKALRVPDNLELPEEVVLFPGCWANYNDPDGEKQSAIRIFQALGVRVHVPELACCGISKITQGDRQGATSDWEKNITTLLPFVKRGAKIIFSAPSCFLASTHDLPRLISSRDAEMVVDACVDAHDLLVTVFENEDMRKQLKSLEYRKLAYHQPCHSKVSKLGDRPERLVSLIPEAPVEALDAGCCGLSGTFGMKTTNFDMSIAIGTKLFSRVNQVNPEVVFTPCGVCQMQIMQGNPDRTIMHPLRLLYDALP